jgi:hypothetical protein
MCGDIAKSCGWGGVVEALSVLQDSIVLAFSEQPPDDQAWAAIQDHYNNALDELHVWSTENCILTPEPQR